MSAAVTVEAIGRSRLSVGVEVIDRDHKKMIAIAIELYEAILTGRPRARCPEPRHYFGSSSIPAAPR